MGQQQRVSYRDVLVDRAVAVVDDAHTGEWGANVGFLLKCVAVVGSGVVKHHQVGFNLVGKDGLSCLFSPIID